MHKPPFTCRNTLQRLRERHDDEVVQQQTETPAMEYSDAGPDHATHASEKLKNSKAGADEPLPS